MAGVIEALMEVILVDFSSSFGGFLFRSLTMNL